jgi:hypothetical protein
MGNPLRRFVIAASMATLAIVPVLAASDSDIVVFNVQNNKYHSRSCVWACRCTVHCINLTRGEAHKRGGIPCKVCGGGESD